MKNDMITLDHGSGGQKTSDLIDQLVLTRFNNPILSTLPDGASLPSFTQNLVFSTDSFVVDPWKFPGGDIGKLAVCGTINDLCMVAGTPKYLSCALIIEEGFLIKDLEGILDSMAQAAKENGVMIVTGDTKVIECHQNKQIYINTSGIGLQQRTLDPSYQEGDVLVISGSIGRHGASILMAREDIHLQGNLYSDCASLKRESQLALAYPSLRILRDPTRGGVATTCIELIEHTDFGLDLFEKELPIDDDVRTLCDLLGIDPLYLACEGRMLSILSKEDATKLIQELGPQAKIIGQITKTHPKQLYLKTKIGASRCLRKLSGMPLPRIC